MTKREQQKADYESEARRVRRPSAWLEYHKLCHEQIKFSDTCMGKASLRALGEIIQELNRIDWLCRLGFVLASLVALAIAVVYFAKR